MEISMSNPILIQGGMGVGVSNWRLARAVSTAGQLGVVSGTFLDTLLARRLQDGDPGGHMLRACKHFPDETIVERVWSKYFIPGGRKSDQPYATVPMFRLRSSRELIELTILANFVEVYLAKEGHDGVVGINYLEKIQLPTLPSLYGAMLAGVDYVLMGAGIPKAIPGILDGLSNQQRVSMRLDVALDGKTIEQQWSVEFDPAEFLPGMGPLKRPQFIAIVSSHTLALNLFKKASGKINGFVVENHTAGGHNAPPRGTMVIDDKGEPVYGPRDEANVEEMAKIGLPFWLAGSFGSPEMLQRARDAHAAGIQVGTPFAYCDESGISVEIKQEVISDALNDSVSVFTDPVASACGYPFKVVSVESSLSDEKVYAERQRVCDLGYLRTAYVRPDGTLGYRCPGEPVEDYVRKGGKIEDTVGRKCLCNGLAATVEVAQVRHDGYVEPPLVTAGATLSQISRFVRTDKRSYSAREVIDYICSPVNCPATCS
jgi:nitronate monooxygenase